MVSSSSVLKVIVRATTCWKTIYFSNLKIKSFILSQLRSVTLYQIYFHRHLWTAARSSSTKHSKNPKEKGRGPLPINLYLPRSSSRERDRGCAHLLCDIADWVGVSGDLPKADARWNVAASRSDNSWSKKNSDYFIIVLVLRIIFQGCGWSQICKNTY